MLFIFFVLVFFLFRLLALEQAPRVNTRISRSPRRPRLILNPTTTPREFGLKVLFLRCSRAVLWLFSETKDKYRAKLQHILRKFREAKVRAYIRIT